LIQRGIALQLPEGFVLTGAAGEGQWMNEDPQKGVAIKID